MSPSANLIQPTGFLFLMRRMTSRIMRSFLTDHKLSVFLTQLP
jgi:chromosome condensin MukBEF MukE localization factor